MLTDSCICGIWPSNIPPATLWHKICHKHQMRHNICQHKPLALTSATIHEVCQLTHHCVPKIRGHTNTNSLKVWEIIKYIIFFSELKKPHCWHGESLSLANKTFCFWWKREPSSTPTLNQTKRETAIHSWLQLLKCMTFMKMLVVEQHSE